MLRPGDDFWREFQISDSFAKRQSSGVEGAACAAGLDIFGRKTWEDSAGRARLGCLASYSYHLGNWGKRWKITGLSFSQQRYHLNVRTPFFLRQDLCQFWWGQCWFVQPHFFWGSPIIFVNELVAKMTRRTWGYWGMLRLTSQNRQGRRNEYTTYQNLNIYIYLYCVYSLDNYINISY